MDFTQPAQLDCIVAAILATRLIPVDVAVAPQDALLNALLTYAKLLELLRRNGGALTDVSSYDPVAKALA